MRLDSILTLIPSTGALSWQRNEVKLVVCRNCSMDSDPDFPSSVEPTSIRFILVPFAYQSIYILSTVALTFVICCHKAKKPNL